mmetsp:Transcript_24747/g.48532  ORF Transcript_24747/g.48532 Transcript_24747/m.48532 type:complete len:128 (+) Transcript_24747:573-956(+)
MVTGGHMKSQSNSNLEESSSPPLGPHYQLSKTPVPPLDHVRVKTQAKDAPLHPLPVSRGRPSKTFEVLQRKPFKAFPPPIDLCLPSPAGIPHQSTSVLPTRPRFLKGTLTWVQTLFTQLCLGHTRDL